VGEVDLREEEEFQHEIVTSLPGVNRNEECKLYIQDARKVSCPFVPQGNSSISSTMFFGDDDEERG